MKGNCFVNNYFAHVDYTKFNISLDELQQESTNLDFVRVEIPYTEGEIREEFWSSQNYWFSAKVNLFLCPNVKKIICKLEEVMQDTYIKNNIIIETKLAVRFFRQLANSELSAHRDENESCTALNFALGKNNSPITFTDIGDIHYTCCLLNVENKHFVKANNIDRYIFRISPINKKFAEVYNKFKSQKLLLEP